MVILNCHEMGCFMATRYFSLVCGLVFTLLGIMAFIPGFVSTPLTYPALNVESGFGLLLGAFPVNIILKVFFLAVGLWGIYSYRNYMMSRNYGRVMCIVFGVGAVMGMIPVLNTTFGLMPLYGNNIWLHGLSCIAAGYFGYRKPVDALESNANLTDRSSDRSTDHSTDMRTPSLTDPFRRADPVNRIDPLNPLDKPRRPYDIDRAG